jgi:hypothetical protein
MSLDKFPRPNKKPLLNPLGDKLNPLLGPPIGAHLFSKAITLQCHDCFFLASPIPRTLLNTKYNTEVHVVGLPKASH